MVKEMPSLGQLNFEQRFNLRENFGVVLTTYTKIEEISPKKVKIAASLTDTGEVDELVLSLKRFMRPNGLIYSKPWDGENNFFSIRDNGEKGGVVAVIEECVPANIQRRVAKLKRSPIRNFFDKLQDKI